MERTLARVIDPRILILCRMHAPYRRLNAGRDAEAQFGARGAIRQNCDARQALAASVLGNCNIEFTFTDDAEPVAVPHPYRRASASSRRSASNCSPMPRSWCASSGLDQGTMPASLNAARARWVNIET